MKRQVTKDRDTLISQTITAWQPYFTKPLNPEDAEEIIYRWSGFLNIISRSLNTQA